MVSGAPLHFSSLSRTNASSGNSGTYISKLPSATTVEQALTPAFHRLNNQISAFVMSVPPDWMNSIYGPQHKIEVERVMLQIAPHACTLLLHDPLLRLHDESAAYCETACNGILRVLRMLITSGANLCSFPAALCFIMTLTGKTLARRLELIRRDFATYPEGGGISSVPSSTTPSSNTTSPARPVVVGLAPGESFPTAGLGNFASSEKEQDLRGDIDLIFNTLCLYGQTWPIGGEFRLFVSRMHCSELSANLTIVCAVQCGKRRASQDSWGSQSSHPSSSKMASLPTRDLPSPRSFTVRRIFPYPPTVYWCTTYSCSRSAFPPYCNRLCVFPSSFAGVSSCIQAHQQVACACPCSSSSSWSSRLEGSTRHATGKC